MSQPFVLIVVGLALEARVARKCKGASICCRRGEPAAHAMKEALDNPACRGVISFGIAGGLDARLRTGMRLVASQVITPEGAVSTHEAWSRALLNSSAEAVHATILGMDYVILEPGKKHEFFKQTGAVAVDTESHITALMAKERNLPFTCLRIVADPVHLRVPKAALSGLHEDGRAYPLGVGRELLRRPYETPALLAIALATWRARRVLVRALALAGDYAGLPTLTPGAVYVDESSMALGAVATS